LLGRISSPQRNTSPSPQSSARSSESPAFASTRTSQDNRSTIDELEMADIIRSRTGSANPILSAEHVKTEQVSGHRSSGVLPTGTNTPTAVITTDLPQWTALSPSSFKGNVSSATYEAEQDELYSSSGTKSQHYALSPNNIVTTTIVNGGTGSHVPLQMTDSGTSTATQRPFFTSTNTDDSTISAEDASLESSLAAATDRLRLKISQNSSLMRGPTAQYEDLMDAARMSLKIAESSREFATAAAKMMDVLMIHVKKAQEEACNAVDRSEHVLRTAEAALRNEDAADVNEQAVRQLLAEADDVVRLSHDVLVKQKGMQSASRHDLNIARAEAERYKLEADKEREERQRLEEILRSRDGANTATASVTTEDVPIQEEASKLHQAEEAEAVRKQAELRKKLEEERRRKEEDKQAQEEYRRRRAAYWEQKIKQQDNEAARLRQQRGEKDTSLTPETPVEHDNQPLAARLSNGDHPISSNHSLSGDDIRLSESKSRASTIQQAAVPESISSSQTLLDPSKDNTQAVDPSRPESLANPITNDNDGALSDSKSMVLSIEATPPLSQPSPATLRHLAPRRPTPAFVKANIKRESPAPNLSEGLDVATRAYSNEPSYVNPDPSDLHSPPPLTSNYGSRDLTPPLPEANNTYSPGISPSPSPPPSIHSPPPAQEPLPDSRSFREERGRSHRVSGGRTFDHYSPSPARPIRSRPRPRSPPPPPRRPISNSYAPPSAPSPVPPRENAYSSPRTDYYDGNQFDDSRRSGNQNSLKRRRDDSVGPPRSAPAWRNGPDPWEPRSYGGDSIGMSSRRTPPTPDYDDAYGSTQQTSSYSARDMRPTYDNPDNAGYSYSQRQQQRPAFDRAVSPPLTPPLSPRRQQQRLLPMSQSSGLYRPSLGRGNSSIGFGNHTFSGPRSEGPSPSSSFYRDEDRQVSRTDNYGGGSGGPPLSRQLRPLRVSSPSHTSHPPPMQSHSYRPRSRSRSRSRSPPPLSDRPPFSARVLPSESHNGSGGGPSLADRIMRSQPDTASGYYDSHLSSSPYGGGRGESSGPLRSSIPRGRGRGRGQGHTSSNSYHTSGRGHRQLFSRFSSSNAQSLEDRLG
jgi:hypothetical protein